MGKKVYVCEELLPGESAVTTGGGEESSSLRSAGGNGSSGEGGVMISSKNSTLEVEFAGEGALEDSGEGKGVRKPLLVLTLLLPLPVGERKSQKRSTAQTLPGPPPLLEEERRKESKRGEVRVREVKG